MKRLTKKNDKGLGSWTQLGDQYIPAHNIKHKQCVNKLGELEDIEEELGIDLITLFKASKNGFYMINKGKIEFVWRGYLFNLRGHYIHLNCGYKKLDFKLENEPFSDVLLFKDYGITRALTKEELKKNETYYIIKKGHLIVSLFIFEIFNLF